MCSKRGVERGVEARGSLLKDEEVNGMKGNCSMLSRFLYKTGQLFVVLSVDGRV